MDATELKLLRELLGDGPLDITQENVSQALRRLKQKDPEKGELEARKRQRPLGRFLEKKVFKRRERKPEQTTAGTKARVALLPENPHLFNDVDVIRRTLDIPEDQYSHREDVVWEPRGRIRRFQASEQAGGG